MTTIRDPDFAKRLTQAVEDNPDVPARNYGRLSWFQNRLRADFEITASQESIRRWFSGEIKPRPDKVKALADLLQVDEMWLSLGHAPSLKPMEQRLRNAEAAAVVLLAAGFIKICDERPAFPVEDDQRATKEHIDLYAVIRGAQYAFKVSLGEAKVDQVTFSVPGRYDSAFQLGVVHGVLKC